MSVDLQSLSLKELKQLQKDVATAIQTFEERQKQETLQELEAIAKKRGFSLSELTAAIGKRRKPVAPKYAHPDNPELTWTGRGRQPRWVSEALAGGRKLDEFLIAS
ncbi:H-NS family nucleoid-associated regulatory protein [Halodurantibacterium flavum]|uniref:H-NS family nucleoid-associated regulatory protein n=1 Tax=Halodurantibacterium flavum TaxID=1382802 RepID=A0ABW4SB08_9RHOB